jgi:hypothetical protein
MKNLQSFGVQEMDVQDRKNINGGDFGISLVIALVALCITVLNTDWDKAADDFNRGYNS